MDRITAALGISRRRRILPTWMGTRQIRELGQQFVENAVFSARTTSARHVSTIKQVIDSMLAGEMDLALGRLTLKESLQALGYTPEGGFGASVDGESVEGMVPPAVAGQLEDLSSDRRLNFILRTQEALMQGAGQKAKGMEGLAIRQFPAWELVRVAAREVPRDWPARVTLALANLDRPPLAAGAPLVFMKGDPVWAALGSSELFDDALDVDHPPFAFSTGMGWRGVPQDEVRALGITGPAGEPLKDILKVLPRPSASRAGIAPDVLARLKASLAIEEVDGLLKGGLE